MQIAELFSVAMPTAAKPTEAPAASGFEELLMAALAPTTDSPPAAGEAKREESAIEEPNAPTQETDPAQTETAPIALIPTLLPLGQPTLELSVLEVGTPVVASPFGVHDAALVEVRSVPTNAPSSLLVAPGQAELQALVDAKDLGVKDILVKPIQFPAAGELPASGGQPEVATPAISVKPTGRPKPTDEGLPVDAVETESDAGPMESEARADMPKQRNAQPGKPTAADNQAVEQELTMKRTRALEKDQLPYDPKSKPQAEIPTDTTEQRHTKATKQASRDEVAESRVAIHTAAKPTTESNPQNPSGHEDKPGEFSLRDHRDRIEEIATRSHKEVRIELKPLDLEPISVSISRDGAEVQASVNTNDDRFRQAFAANQNVLRDSLQQRGLELGSLQFGVGSHDTADRRSEHPQQGRHQHQALNMPQQFALTNSPTRHSTSSGLDLWI